MSNPIYERTDIVGMLTRIETRMLRGFDALGVNVKATPGWIEVDEEAKTIRLNSAHYTLHAIHHELERMGITTHGQYEVRVQNKAVCYL